MERKNKNQSFSMSPLVKVVPPLPSPPSPWSNDYIGKGNNHEMSGGQGVHGEVVPLKKGPVPPSAPSPWSNDYIGKGNKHEMSGGQGVHGEVVPFKKGPVAREMAQLLRT
ncbi:hypothetical protein FCV25MIE_17192 [Fagus crenata]